MSSEEVGSRRVLVVGARDTSFRGHNGSASVDLLQSEQRLTRYQQALADRIRIVDLGDRGKVLQAARELHAAKPLRGVAAFHEHMLDLAAEIADDLGVPGTTREVVRSVADKGATRALAARASIRQPVYRVLSERGRLVESAIQVGLPAIIKPLGGAGSTDIHLIRDVDDAVQLEQRLVVDPSHQWIIEQYLDGPEYSVESFTGRNGTAVRQIVEKVVDPTTFVEIGHQAPATLTESMRSRIVADVVSLQQAVGLNVGPAHTEVRIVDDEPFLIETHARYGGDRIWEMTGLTTGYFPQAEMIAELSGESFNPATPDAPAAAVRFLTAQQGRVSKIVGVDEARSSTGVVDVHLDVAVGSLVSPLRSSADRLGYVLATAGTAEHAASLAGAAASSIGIHVTSDPGRK